MAQDKSLELAVYAIIGGGTLVATGFKRFLTARKTQDTATSKIASAPQGFVEIQGFAWHEGAIKTNIEGRKCVYYKIDLQKLVSSGKNSRWETVATYGLTQPFYIIDETGAVSVAPINFDFNIQTSETNWNKISNTTKENLLNVFSLITKDLPSLTNSWFFSSSYKCIESFILLGSPIIAHGRLELSQSQKNHDFDSSAHAFYSNILRYQKDKKRALTLLDVNKDGEINEEELRIGMHATAISTVNNLKTIQSTSDLKYYGVLETHSDHRSFIADCHQHHLLSRIGSWNLLFIFGGVGLIFSGIWVVLNI